MSPEFSHRLKELQCFWHCWTGRTRTVGRPSPTTSQPHTPTPWNTSSSYSVGATSEKCEGGCTWELTLAWALVLWVTRQRCTVVPALSSNRLSSALGKSHLSTFSLVPGLNLLEETNQHCSCSLANRVIRWSWKDLQNEGLFSEQHRYQSRVKLAGPSGKSRLWWCTLGSSASIRMDKEPEWAE